jgi:hypothetical protein
MNNEEMARANKIVDAVPWMEERQQERVSFRGA